MSAARTKADGQRPTASLSSHTRCDLVPQMPEPAYSQFRNDIAARGLLTPLEITPDGVVLDGNQRLRAATELGLEQTPVRIVTPDDDVEYMLLCALERRHLSASQRAALAVDLSAYRQLQTEGHERRLANLNNSAEVATLPPRGKTREIAAAWAGVSPRTVQDAAKVAEHDPELFAKVKNGEIAADTAARRIRRHLRDQALPEPGPPPEGPFQLIYADPPWQLGHPDSRHAPENHYPTMPLDEIKGIQIPAADDALLLIWAVNSLLPQALDVIDAWGFHYLTNLVWVKPSIGLGVWTRNRHELLLVGRRGKHPAPDPDQRPDSVLEAKRSRHSAKPDGFYQLIETAWPHTSKLELFHRGDARPGWHCWGNQST
jgi:N6-adenosine-specific RNA methylase IME4